jgi:molecular chaperone GrpE
VLRRGYQLGDRVIRHALVGVVDTVEEAPEEQPSDTADNSTDRDDDNAQSESPAG